MDEVQKAEVTKVVEEVLGNLTEGTEPNKYLELLMCRRTLATLGVVLVAVAKHYGLPISETELLSLGGTVGALVLGHSLRAPNK